MNCADLDRFLEAHVGRRLTVRERDVLTRHLLGCPTCRLRLYELRRFELELAARLPAFAGIEFWNAFVGEPATVLSPPGQRKLLPIHLPPRLPAPASETVRGRPPRPVRGPRPPVRIRPLGQILKRGLGLALVAALGIAGLHRMLVPEADRTPEPTGMPVPATFDRVDFVTADPRTLYDWFRIQLAEAPPVPAPPAGFTLLGGRVEGYGPDARAVVVYEHDGRRLALYAFTRDAGTMRSAATLERDGWTYLLLGDLPVDRLNALTRELAAVP